MVLDNKAGEKEISLQVNVLKRASVIGDPSRLKQIFINLINNAIVYTGWRRCFSRVSGR